MFISWIRISRSKCILLLMISDLVTSMPVAPVKRSPNGAVENSKGFSTSPKILEIQLPLRIATKEDLIAWAKYVMGLMASRINITLSTLKDTELNSVPRDMKFTESEREIDRQSDLNGGRIKDSRRKDASPNPLEENVRFNNNVKTPNRNSALNSDIREDPQIFLPKYPDYGTRNTYDISDNEIFRNANVLFPPPSATYLPLPLDTLDDVKYEDDGDSITRYFFESIARNSSSFQDYPERIPATTSRTFNRRNKAEDLSPIKISDIKITRNFSNVINPILTLPFEAVITITRQELAERNPVKVSPNERDYFAIPHRNPPDEFPPYFERNYTLNNQSGKINVVLDDLERQEEVSKEPKEPKRQEERKKEKKEGSKKRQSSTIGELLKILGVFRKTPKNTTEINLTPPLLKVLKGTNHQKVQVASDKEVLPGRDRRNESQSQPQQEFGQQSDYDDEDEMGGSLQSLIELLPLVVPILEDLSDPESDTDLSELLQAALPILQGLSEGDGEDEGIDIPGIVVPILLNLSGGRDGQGSDVAAILRPIIQLLAPLIGPILGPLVGPLFRLSSNPADEGGSSAMSLVQAIAGPLSQPTGYGGMSPLSNLIAGVVARLSKDLTDGKSGSDLGALISAVVSGVLAGTSSGLSKGSGKHKYDSAMSPTSYGGYGGYGPVPANSVNPIALIGNSIKDILSAGLQVASSLIKAVTGILGASSQESPPSYGAPPSTYGKPAKPSYAPPTNAPYSNTRAPQRQSYQQNKKTDFTLQGADFF